MFVYLKTSSGKTRTKNSAKMQMPHRYFRTFFIASFESQTNVKVSGVGTVTHAIIISKCSLLKTFSNIANIDEFRMPSKKKSSLLSTTMDHVWSKPPCLFTFGTIMVRNVDSWCYTWHQRFNCKGLRLNSEGPWTTFSLPFSFSCSVRHN